jgi:glycerol kinase
VLESTALGAAYLAGLAVGFWASTEEIAAQRGADRVFTPRAGRKAMEERIARWKEAVRRAQGWNKA